MLLIHPLMQLMATVLVLVVLQQGLQHRKKRRKVLPLIHGVNNLVLVLLALFQVYNGWHVINAFVWGNG